MTAFPLPGGATDSEVARVLVRSGLEVAFGLWAEALSSPVATKTNLTDVVTRADRAAEARMVELLVTHRPDDGILGEEGTSRAGTSGRTWVLDPLDGTYNFTRSSERWCTAAALVVDDHALLGAVAGGGAGRTWLGGADLPPTEDGAPLARLQDRPLAGSALLTYLHPPFHDDAVGRTWRRLVAGVATLRMTGSGSLDATDVACGRADLVVQHSVPAWDRLPGEALIRAAGGSSAVLHAGGVDWYVAGAPTAVEQALALLAD